MSKIKDIYVLVVKRNVYSYEDFGNFYTSPEKLEDELEKIYEKYRDDELTGVDGRSVNYDKARHAVTFYDTDGEMKLQFKIEKRHLY